MTCIVYREGTGTTEHDIECESTTCEPGEVASFLAAGWLPHPPGYEAPEPVALEEDDLPTGDEGEGNALQPEVDRLNGEVDALNEEIDGLRAEIDIRVGIEANLNETIEQLNGELAQFRKLTDSTDEPEEEEPEGDDLNPVRAAGRDAGIDGWETMHLASLKKALKEQEA